jgi:hypothetical protein
MEAEDATSVLFSIKVETVDIGWKYTCW